MATIEVTKGNFEEVITRNKMVILDFWASWERVHAPRLVSRRPACGSGARRPAVGFVCRGEHGFH